MGKRFLLYVSVLLLPAPGLEAQEKCTLSGTVTDDSNSETLIGASIVVEEDIGASTITNAYGFYSITLPKGDYTLSVRYLGFHPIEEKVTLTGNLTRDFSLQKSSVELNEVVVTANGTEDKIIKPEMSVHKLPVGVIKSMPAVVGEVDVLKSLLQLPGVTNTQEGASGFNVRGGSVDGNLVLLDEAAVYNTSHLFGYFSVFNADVIKDLKLYKGGIPSNYGGRVSSVLDVYQKEGNKKEYHFSGGIGAVSSRFAAEGPLVKEKSSFIVAGRASYAHLLMKLAGEPNSAYFYDLNAKINYRFGNDNALYLSGYLGNDNFDMNKTMVNAYGNVLGNLRWNHIFSDKLFSNLSAIFSHYDYGLRMKYAGIDWKSDITNYNLKYDFTHYLSGNFRLSYGINILFYRFNPGTIRPFDDSSAVHPDQMAKKNALENAAYIGIRQELGGKWQVNYGLRFSNFMRFGKEDVFVYADNDPVVFNPGLGIYEEAVPTGIISYGPGEKISGFCHFEPRIAVSYAMADDKSVKASYQRMCQYVHLISNTASVSPLDIWAPSGLYLKPEISDQYAIGYSQNFGGGRFALKAEAFYKTIKNKADYIDGANLIAHEAIERVLLNGKARAYGLELMASKNHGNLTGWVSYTLSRAEQKTPGRNAEEPGINNGRWYRANYDKLHNLSITAACRLTSKWSFGGTFTFQSGKAATFPDGKYEYQGVTVASYGERNADSLSPYHHLDLSATCQFKPDKKKGWQSELVVSIYNIYNRNNAASYTFGQNQTTGSSEVKKTSIFGIMPGITYNFRF